MSKKLKAFIEQENQWRSIVHKGKNLLTLDTPEGRQEIANQIDAQLSPENLSCDGELSLTQIRARYSRLVSVAKQLKAIDPKVVIHEMN